jgi:hypothetical protein
MRIMTACVVVLAVALGGCGRSGGGGAKHDDKFTTPDGRVLTKGKMAEVPDLTAAAGTAEFQAAVKRATALTGVRPKPFERENDDGTAKATGGVVFNVPHAAVEKNLDAWRKELLAQGAYLFRMDNSFGIGGSGAEDEVGLLPTTDKYVVLAAVQTDGANYDLMTGDIIEWLQGMEKTQPWELTEAGMDYVAGRFTQPVGDRTKLARQMYDFCPDIVDQGTESVEKLAAELKKGELFLWWD